jgi:hypothetical protein
MVKNNNRQIVFTSVHVIPMDTDQLLQNQTVVTKDGKITAIGRNAKFDKDALVIDGKGKYLMPGLAEMHGHVPPVNDMDPMKDVLELFAYHGITTVRGMLGHPKHLELRKGLINGDIFGPRFITSGPSINGNSAPDPTTAITMVKNQKEAGYDFIKVHPGLSWETFSAMATAAREANHSFSGHVPFAVNVWRGIEAGYATIDHLDGFVDALVPGIQNMSEQEVGIFGLFVARRADTTKIPALIAALKKGGTWVVPTQALAERWFSPDRTTESLSQAPEMKYMSTGQINGWVQSKNNLMSNPSYNANDVRELIRLRRKLIYECNRNGVGLLLGCDAPQVFNVPGISTHHELQYLVDAGLTPYEALRTGTVNVGNFLKRKDIGTVKTGSVSDLILLNGNPLQDISQSKNIAGVMIGSTWLPREVIDSELKKLEKQ